MRSCFTHPREVSGCSPRSRAAVFTATLPSRTNATASRRNSALYFDGRPTRDTPFTRPQRSSLGCPSKRGKLNLSPYSIVNATTATYGTGLTQAAPSNAAGTPSCPTDTPAVAGGATNHDQTNGFISSVAPNSSEKYWVVTDRDLNPPSYGEHFLPVGICVSAT